MGYFVIIRKNYVISVLVQRSCLRSFIKGNIIDYVVPSIVGSLYSSSDEILANFLFFLFGILSFALLLTHYDFQTSAIRKNFVFNAHIQKWTVRGVDYAGRISWVEIYLVFT